MKTDKRTPGKRATSGAVMAVSVTAVACAACCTLPFALPAAFLGSFGGLLSWSGNALSWLKPVALVAAAASWLWIAYRSHRPSSAPSRLTLIVMGIATIIIVIGIASPRIEQFVIG